MDRNIIESGGFYFIHNFDSGNLGHVERVPTELIAPSTNHRTNGQETPDYEFNLWTRPDCAGTEFENGNRTWFYFGVQASEPGVLVRFNLINLNKQGKMYNQGMAPVTRTLPGKPHWERIKDRPVHSTDDNTFTLTFKYRTSDNLKATTFFAFTYPFSFAELQIALNSIDLKMLPLPTNSCPDDIYYCRECLIYSLEGRRVDLLTISSHHGITHEREDRLKNLFPENKERPFKFKDKKVIFVSARVHPGETPSSFVFNGFLNLMLNRNDPVAIQLRKLYVFKLIPFLNPDGVARGHYRTDTRGVNLNRVYLNPSLMYHPTVYASRALIRYHHFGCEKEDTFDDAKSMISASIPNISESSEQELSAPSSNIIKKKGPIPFRQDGDKSSATLKPPADDCEPHDTDLAEQVLDMKIQEMPSQTSETSFKFPVSESKPTVPSVLNDHMLKTCLGYDVHVSTSDELNIQGPNPLRPLRDTLKDSISLLMESNGSIVGDSLQSSSVKMGWCRVCRAAAARAEHSGVTDMAPGYSAMHLEANASPTISSIEEYRDVQKQQIEIEEEKKMTLEALKLQSAEVYFCTNCFKRYATTDCNEEISIVQSVSRTSVAVSAGESELQTPRNEVIPEKLPPLSKEDKPKSGAGGKKKAPPAAAKAQPPKEPESGLYLYIDLHGHASKKGIFMYGNHFEDLENSVECMLLPRIMSLNNLHFHFSSCNFTERNMYLKDRRDGMSREGSGRVAVLKATGLVRSYTLECNYNTGRLVNVLPPAVRDPPSDRPQSAPAPPKYTPHIFEEVGRSLGASILDLTSQHPNSRIPGSEHRSIQSVRDWLRAHTRTMRPQLTMSRLRPKTSSPSRVPLFARSKAKVTDERKENAFAGARGERGPPYAHDLVAMSAKLKKAEPVKMPSRYLDPEPKKSLTSKRRNILAIRKPNSSKSQLTGVVKAKVSRRSADDTESPRPSVTTGKLSKRGSFTRSLRGSVPRAMASSSSSEGVAGRGAGGGWPDAPPAAKRRPLQAAAAPRLKKIRLKTGL